MSYLRSSKLNAGHKIRHCGRNIVQSDKHQLHSAPSLKSVLGQYKAIGRLSSFSAQCGMWRFFSSLLRFINCAPEDLKMHVWISGWRNVISQGVTQSLLLTCWPTLTRCSVFCHYHQNQHQHQHQGSEYTVFMIEAATPTGLHVKLEKRWRTCF